VTVALVVPPLLARNVTTTWGAAGASWLAALPNTLAELANDWELELGEAFELSYHWVCRAWTADGTAAVLKLGLPGADDHLSSEAAALAAWAGQGAVRLLRFDPAGAALLLEQARPGDPASALVPDDDELATAAAVDLLQRLHAAPPPAPGVPTLQARLDAFDAHLARFSGDRPLNRDLVVRARGLGRELCASAPPARLLHGDLHHDNVLRAEREPWLAIDPHGVVGDPGYDAGAWLYNPDPPSRDPALLALVPARLEQLAEGLEQPLDRVTAWGFVQAVLSAVWSAESGDVPDDRSLDVAALLLSRLG
jgi:streptomycin 6-kinase